MKKYLLNFGLLSLVTLLFFTCGKEDDMEPADTLIVSTQDLTIEISENVDTGQVLGTVSGTSNEGSVTFAIESQSPGGALAIDEASGELTVADPAVFDFDVNPVITAVVNVTKTTVTKTANVTINLLEANNCPAIDASALVGDLISRDVGFPSYPVVGAYDGCGNLTLTGTILGYPFIEEPVFLVTLVDSIENYAIATLERQPYPADGFNLELEAHGVYDAANGILIMAYQMYEDGAPIFPGLFRISSAICNFSQDVSVWNGPISIEVVGEETTSAVGIVDCDQIQLEAVNISGGTTCADLGDLYLYVSEDGSAEISGDFTIWWCDDNFYNFGAQGTYDVATQEIRMNFSMNIYQEAAIFREGELIIRPQ